MFSKLNKSMNYTPGFILVLHTFGRDFVLYTMITEVNSMELSSSDKERIQHQYDALAKKTLVGEAKSHRRTLAKRAAREVTFSDLSESELAQLFTTDEYESDYFRFQVSGFDVLVKNELLAEALNALPERKRDIILLSYFLDMSDAEIGELLNVVRTTVFRHRKSALAKIKQYLEGKADDELYWSSIWVTLWSEIFQLKRASIGVAYLL